MKPEDCVESHQTIRRGSRSGDETNPNHYSGKYYFKEDVARSLEPCSYAPQFNNAKTKWKSPRYR